MGVVPEWAIGIVLIIGATAAAQVVVKMFRASARTLPTSDSEISELRQTVETMKNRLGELEERVDFTERLLAQNREADRLGSPPR